MNPSALNYRMPPEWAEHERTLISWPVQESMTFPEDYETVCNGYAEVIKAIAEFEPVTVLVDPQEVKKVSLMLGEDNIELLPLEHSDAWLRDNGPTFVKNESGELAGVNWKFNAWGEKYAPWDLDNAVPTALLKHYGVKQFDAPLILEGGSIHVDGDGTLLSTEECLLNRNRNADLSREQIEELVQAYTGTEKVIWLKRGLDGDETDGHIDNIACFAAPGKVILQVCEDPKDENYAITQENLQILEQARDARGRALEIVKLLQPPKAFYKESRLTLSYLNFYFVNGGIILPVFGGAAAETDRLAVETLQAVFPDRRIRTIDGMAIIGEGGNVHCITQQMPARS
ncbi:MULTISPECIES: agmatine/peptidylarginine deiminase [Paenibacillus]|uniref:Agmatine deiminase n=1 Tax=Paenibacillus campinasensis TaxID=66347 RepID=A0ABW9T3I7_9BACL|nr:MULTISPECIES: agmatine deiminase family protein [Paenibacillus]MUG67854.1 agmatine deiminase [Paenibacillus campinasensis]PAK48574.1 agmatine deiminase [Paenibacillus sp. 7541]